MIRINLLDASQAKGRRGARARAATGGGNPAGALVVAVAVVLTLVIDGGVGWTLYQRVTRAGEHARQLSADIRAIDAKIAERSQSSEQTLRYQQVLNNQKEVLRTLDPDDRILWCEKLNMLAALVPQNVFLTDIDVSEVVDMVENTLLRQAHERWLTLDQKKRGAEPEVIKKPVIHYDMTLTGLAIGHDSAEQFANVMAFHRAITTYRAPAGADGKTRRFMDGFDPTVNFGSIEATTYEDASVNKFVFKLRTLNQGEDAAAAPAPAVKPASAKK
jgi:cytochrome b